MVIAKSSSDKEIISKINPIVPVNSALNPDSVTIYELSESGEVNKLPSYQGLPSDENYLNSFLAESNELFVKLMEIEDLCL